MPVPASKVSLIASFLVMVFLVGCLEESTRENEGEGVSEELSCTVVENAGQFTMSCPDGTTATFGSGTDGAEGNDGQPCTAADNQDGTQTITCPDGSEIVVQDIGAMPG